MARDTSVPDTTIVSAKLPNGWPPYEDPLDLRFLLHFAPTLGSSPSCGDSKVEKAMENLADELYDSTEMRIDPKSASTGPNLWKPTETPY